MDNIESRNNPASSAFAIKNSPSSPNFKCKYMTFH